MCPAHASTGKECDSDTAAPHGKAARDATISDLVGNGSIEFSFGSSGAISSAAQLLPFGMSAYVPAPLGRSLETNLEWTGKLHAAGLDPVPHIAARNIASKEELRAFLQSAVAEHGVHRVMLVGGDQTFQGGPYASGIDLLTERVLSESGIREVALAGYPEGHWSIPGDALIADLESKVASAQEQDLGVEIVTQFSFSPARVSEYCTLLGHRMPEIPVYVGIAGPASGRRLRHFAARCGVSTSLLGKGFEGVKISRQIVHTDPGDQLEALAHHCLLHRNGNVIGIHIYSFGGFVQTAKWIREKLRHS